jgi:hypothetical protein
MYFLVVNKQYVIIFVHAYIIHKLSTVILFLLVSH